MIGGHVQMMFDADHHDGVELRQGRAGAGRSAPPGAKRSELTPDVPTVVGSRRARLRGDDLARRHGARPGRRKPIIDKLNAEIAKVINRPDVKEAWAKQGAVPMVMTPAEFDTYLRKDIEKWADVVKKTGASAN